MVFIIWFRLRLPKRSSTKENDTMTLILAALLTACFSPESQPAGLGHDGGFDDSGTTSDGGGSDGGGTTDDGGSTTDGGSDGGGTTADGGTDDCWTLYLDADEDGYGDRNQPWITCEEPNANWVDNGDDCDDTNRDVNPDAEKVCGETVDGVYADCTTSNHVFTSESTTSSTTDETDMMATSGCDFYYRDRDGDTYGSNEDYEGSPATVVCACEGGTDAHTATNYADCDDLDPYNYPGAPEPGIDCSTY